MELISKLDALRNADCYLIDIFPCTVPETADRRYFAVEAYLHNSRNELNERFCRLLLKLYCYYDFWIFVGEQLNEAPDPEQLIVWLQDCFKRKCQNIILLPKCDAMICFDGDDLYMSLYNPDRELCELMAQLSGAEGIFFYKAP